MTVAIGFLDDGKWSACFGMSYQDMLEHDREGSNLIIGRHRRICGAMGLADGRNAVVREFLHSTAEWLVFIDTDMGFPPDIAERLTAHGHPIVGALCFAQRRGAPGPLHSESFRIEPVLYRFPSLGYRYGVAPVYDYRSDPGYPLVTVDATGAACLAVRRDVYETISSDWFTPITVDDGTYGEDLSFCVRAGQAGFPIHVDASIRTCHDKGGIFLDENTYASSLKQSRLG